MSLPSPDYVRIFDTTLRDGEQMPGVSLTPQDKLEIARQLAKLGVDTIEAGFPQVSKGEEEAVKLIAREGLGVEICALARADKKDIDIAIGCDVNCVHTFIATSELHMKYKLQMTPEEVLERAVESVEYIKAHGLICEFSAEDATRSNRDFLRRVYVAAAEAGADRLNIPDTVGVMIPKKMYELVKDIAEATGKLISVHCHDDFGMAVANSLAGVEAGARQVHATVNGIGERAGNAALEEVVVALHLLYEMETGVNTQLISETSQLVSRLTGVYVQPNKAVVGANAFAHESGIHTHGVISHPLTYEPIPPEYVGRRRRLVAGKHAGAHGLKAELEAMGIYPTDEQLRVILERVKELGDKGKTITDADLLAIARSVVGGVQLEERVVSLADLVVTTGTNIMPTASVKLIMGDTERQAAEIGVGPVDAAMKAVQKITKDLVDARLREFRLEAVTGGSDALAEVTVRVEDDEGNVVSATAAREDIVLAGVEAYIEGINKLLVRKKVGGG